MNIKARSWIRTTLRAAGATATAGVLVLLGTAPALAQVSTGVIEVVTQPPLPGVAVQAANTATGLRRVAVTDAQGLARILALPPGTYDVSLQVEGCSPPGYEGVVLRVGQTVRLSFSETPEVSDTITVVSTAPIFDVYKTDSSTNIVPEQIEQLPVADRDFQRLAFIAPGVQRERGAFRFIAGGPVIGAGGNASQSTILVDGFDFTDQALGLARTRFSQDAIREFRVIANRFDAEVGGSAGGALSIVTRSGGNDLAGTLFAFYRADSLRAKGELEQDKLDFNRYQLGFTLGGPIAADKTHFFSSLETIDEENITLFRPGGAFAGLADDVEHPFTQLLGLATVDHQFSPGSTGSAKLVYERYREDNFRVGGIADVANGQELNRDNWNLGLSHTRVFSEREWLNEARLQFGHREYEEPTNSHAVEEWFSGGITLKTGANYLGDLLGEGDYWELRDTFRWSAGRHDFKAGLGIYHVDERSVIDTFQEGLFVYLSDDRSYPLLYLYGVGSSDVEVKTDITSVFLQDDWRPSERLTVSLGLRYDYDTDGNNPDFTHPLVGDRDVDDDNFQPRVGFSWDVTGNGANVVRGGAGLFTGRYLLIPAFTELQQNGVSGRVTHTNLNLPPWFTLDPNDPENTGFPLSPDITLMADSLEAPETVQATLGYTRRLGRTGLYFDAEAVYADGDNEIVVGDANFGGNGNPVRLNPFYNQINTYTNAGYSEYQAIILSVNGTLKGGHLIASSVTFADKENVADDFSPVFPTGYPSDPADLDGEYGRSRGVEDYRIVVSAVFRLPWNVNLAPIWEYGSGQPWNHILGYDFNGDGKNSDRPSGVERNSMDGPSFNQLSLRLTKSLKLRGGNSVELILEGFNVLNHTNWDVTSVDNAEFLAGPTLANPGALVIRNPSFGTYRATLPPREIQAGVKFRF